MPDSIVIAGALAHRAGYGGHAWALLQYIWGFRALGFEVAVIDRLEPEMMAGGSEETALDYLRGLLERDAGGESLAGLFREEAVARTRAARFFKLRAV
jgi:hypothetical protein